MANTRKSRIKDPIKKLQGGLGRRLRTYFLTGVLITVPLSITVYLAYAFVTVVDAWVDNWLPAEYSPDAFLPFSIPGLGVLIVIILVTVIGAIAAGFFGRIFVRIYEGILNRTPIVRSIYSSIKQLLETVFSQQSEAFRNAVLLEYPKKDVWVLGFVTGRTKGEVQDKTKEELLSVFVPTTPNPTSGFLVFIPKRLLIYLDLPVEDAFKMLISSGIVVPDINARKKGQKRKATAKQK